MLDLFMGSGTTGEAALSTDRRFVGVEAHPAHFALAVDRLDPGGRYGRTVRVPDLAAFLAAWTQLCTAASWHPTTWSSRAARWG